MVHRWRLEDPSDPNPDTKTWTFPINPNAASPLFAPRSITSAATTALDGQTLFFEGNPKPQDWTFSGDIIEKEHYETLRSWVQDRKRRLYLYDHFGRRITLQLVSFEPTPKRSVGKYWRHTYDVHATVIAISDPIADNDGYIYGSLDNTSEPPGKIVPSFTAAVNRATVTFDGSASSDSHAPISTYTWIFGDGSTGDGPAISHTYAANGTYAVTLVVADAAGGVATVTRTVTVAAPVEPPVTPPPPVIPPAINVPSVDFTFTVTDLTVNAQAAA